MRINYIKLFDFGKFSCGQTVHDITAKARPD